MSWQVVPIRLVQMLRENDAAASRRAMLAVLKMAKLDLARLERAYRGD